MKSTESSKRFPNNFQREESKKPKFDSKRRMNPSTQTSKSRHTYQASSNYLANNSGKNAKMLLDKSLKEGLENIKNLLGKKENVQFQIFHHFENKNLEMFETELLYNWIEETKKENSNLPELIREININDKSVKFEYDSLIPLKESKEKLSKECVEIETGIEEANRVLKLILEKLNIINHDYSAYFNNKDLIEYENNKLREDIVLLDERISRFEIEENLLKDKKRENYYIGTEIIGNICMYKPYLKKFLIIRTDKDSYEKMSSDLSKHETKVEICNRRRSLIISFKNNSVKASFDHIFSLLDSKFEIPHSTDDFDNLINEEILDIFSNIFTKNEEFKNICVTYIKPLSDIFIKNSKVFTLFNKMINKLAAINTDIIVSFNLIRKGDISPINERIKVTNDTQFDMSNLFNNDYILKLNKLTEDEEKVFGFTFYIKINKKKQCNVKFVVIDLKSTNLVKSVCGKLTEINVIKLKGKNKSGQKSTKKEFSHILDEIDEAYHILPCFIDIDINDLKGDTFNFLQDLFLKYYNK